MRDIRDATYRGEICIIWLPDWPTSASPDRRATQMHPRSDWLRAIRYAKGSSSQDFQHNYASMQCRIRIPMSLRSDMSACRRGGFPIMHSCASLLENITSPGNRNSGRKSNGTLIRIPYRRALISYVAFLGFPDINTPKHLIYIFLLLVKILIGTRENQLTAHRTSNRSIIFNFSSRVLLFDG